MKLKAPDITATGVIAIVGLCVAGFAIWKAKGVIKDAVKWVSDIPAAVKDNLASHGVESAKSYTPQSPEMQDLTGRVYADPMVNDAGMSFIYF
jgi:hypothetical protein